MAKRLLLILALIVLGALGWLATRSGERTRAGLQMPDAAPRAPLDVQEDEDALPRPVASEGATAVEPESAPTTDELAPLPDPGDAREAVRTAELVTLYQHAAHDVTFPGETWKVALGLTDAGLAFTDDDVSALDVPDGLSVTLYEDKGGTGHRLSLGPGRHNLAPHGFNDRVSSLRVELLAAATTESILPTLELFRDVPAEGDLRRADWNLVLPAERTNFLFTAANGDFEAYTVSALRIPPGHEALLYEQPDGQGLAFGLGPGYHELSPAGFNDRAASIRFLRSTKR